MTFVYQSFEKLRFWDNKRAIRFNIEKVTHLCNLNRVKTLVLRLALMVYTDFEICPLIRAWCAVVCCGKLEHHQFVLFGPTCE